MRLPFLPPLGSVLVDEDESARRWLDRLPRGFDRARERAQELLAKVDDSGYSLSLLGADSDEEVWRLAAELADDSVTPSREREIKKLLLGNLDSYEPAVADDTTYDVRAIITRVRAGDPGTRLALRFAYPPAARTGRPSVGGSTASWRVPLADRRPDPNPPSDQEHPYDRTCHQPRLHALRRPELDAWTEFATATLGMMAVPAGPDRLLLRADHHSYRLDVRLGDTNGVQALGWEVDGPTSLEALSESLSTAGYKVEWLDEDAAAERKVTQVVRFRDPDDMLDLELYWGLQSADERFASPLGASFVADDLGLGHVFQVVSDQARHHDLYLNILGFRLSDHIAFGGGVEATFTHCNPRHHSYAFVANPNRPLGIGHFMLEVTELDVIGRAMDRIADENTPLIRTFGKHTNDKMTSLYVVTPSNVGLEFGTGGILIDDATWRPVRYESAHYWGHRSPDHD